MKEEFLLNEKNIRFADLLKICKDNFGDYRICGSHYIFKTPWKGFPKVNLQKIGKDAKPYQVKQVKAALAKLNELKGVQDEKE